MKRKELAPLAILLLLLGVALVWAIYNTTSDDSTDDLSSDPAQYPAEQAVTTIPLTEPLAQRDSEVSGMAWYGDYLIMLPQYPSIFGADDASFIFALPKADLLAFLDGSVSGPLEPIPVLFVEPDWSGQIDGFQGYEAIAFNGDRAFLTIEADSGSDMAGYLVAALISTDLSALQLDASSLLEIPQPVTLDNKADESIIVTDEMIITIYEASGVDDNPAPIVHLYDLDLAAQGTPSFPHVEYRITDATDLDGEGRFWAINYLYPGSKGIDPANEALAQIYGQGYTHARHKQVERLLEFQYNDSGITLVGGPPIQMELTSDDSRNWEGLVRLDERGFLIMTDKFPETILGFVSAP